MATSINSGIYCIVNKVSGKVYIGSTVNFKIRRDRHFYTLQKGIHPNEHLQRAYDKHGADAFVFGIIERVPNHADLISREQFWIDERGKTHSLYNLARKAGSALGIKRSAETKKRMSEAQKARKYSPSEETRAKMAAAKIGTHFKKGKKLSPESCARIAASKIGKKASEETRKKLSLARMGNRNAVGNKQSKETRRKRVESMKRTFALRRIAEGQLWLPL